MTQTENQLIKLGVKEGLINIQNSKITYILQNKTYNFADPEEPVRARTYVKLVLEYKYPANRISLEVYPPRREPKLPADIVVFEDDELEHAYLVVEAKPTSSDSDVEVAKREGLGNANLLNAPYLLLACENTEIAYNLEKQPSLEALEKYRIPSIPTFYGKTPQYKYKKGGGAFFDLGKAGLNELINRFQVCHNAIWEGGKRDPAEAFDEMSKLMFAKFYDERFTKTGEYYRFQIGTYENPYIMAKRVKEIYQEVQDKEPNVFKKPIEVPDYVIFEVVKALYDISLKETDLDAKGRAYESFLGKVFRGEFGQFFTPREIVDFMVRMIDPSEKDLVMDPACGSGGFLLYSIKLVGEKIRRNYKGDQDTIIRLNYDFSHFNVFGIEINDRIARVSMMDMVIHEDGHTNIECNDALGDYRNFDPRRDIRPSKYHIVLTNPPFGAVEKRHEILKTFELGSKTKRRKQQRKEALFIERCLDLARTDGKIGIVVPDGILNNIRDAPVRKFIRENSKIIAIVSLPQYAFMPFGSGMTTSILFLQKVTEGIKEDYPIFMALADNIGYDSTGREISENDLFGILKFFLTNTQGSKALWVRCKNLKNSLKVKELKESFNTERLDPKYYYLATILDQELSKIPYKLELLKSIVSEPITSGTRPGGRAKYVMGEIPSLEGGNITDDGRIDLTDLKYIPLSFHEKHLKSEVKPLDILMVKDGATTGKVAIIPPNFPFEKCNINEHLFRIRVKEGIDPYYVHAFLFSSLGQMQVEREGSGGAQKGIIRDSVEKLLIPIPPPEVQNLMAKSMEEGLVKIEDLKKELKTTIQNIQMRIVETLSRNPRSKR